jgi:hypothetical protein
LIVEQRAPRLSTHLSVRVRVINVPLLESESSLCRMLGVMLPMFQHGPGVWEHMARTWDHGPSISPHTARLVRWMRFYMRATMRCDITNRSLYTLCQRRHLLIKTFHKPARSADLAQHEGLLPTCRGSSPDDSSQATDRHDLTTNGNNTCILQLVASPPSCKCHVFSMQDPACEVAQPDWKE